MDTQIVECLLCHTVHSTTVAGEPGRAWHCVRCGQHWDASRVAAVMNYRQWLKAEGITGYGAIA